MSAAMPWVKLYTEMLDDPKIGKLPDAMKWRFVQLVLLAGECDAEGCIANGDVALTIGEVAWRLRLDETQLAADIEHFKKIGLVSDDDNTLCVVNFTKRQGRPQEDKRAAWRERQARKRAADGANTKTPPPPPEPGPPNDANMSHSALGNVTRDSRVSHAPRVEESREDKKDIAAKPASELSLTHNTSMSNATEPPAVSPPSTTAPQTDRNNVGDALQNIFESALKAKANPALATIRKWGLPAHLAGICEDYADIAKGTIVKASDKGLFVAGAGDINELFKAAGKTYSKAWMAKAIETATWAHAHPRALDKSFRALFKANWKPADAPADDGFKHVGWRQDASGAMVQVVKHV